MQERIIVSLATDPRPRSAERLRGKSERYKIALGIYRIIYRISDGALLVLVLKVGKKRGPEFWAEIEDLV